jgi:hypothetical protein
MKARRTKSLYANGESAIQPRLKSFVTGTKATNAQIASLESRLNGQQKRIRDLQSTCSALWDAFKSLGPLKPGVITKTAYEDRIPLPRPHERQQ